MIKICYVVTISSTIRSFFIQQLQFLSKNGFEVHVACSPDNTIQGELGNSIIYHSIYIPRGYSFICSFKSIKKLRQLFREERFDLVQYSTPNASFCAAIASKKEKIKIRNYHLMGFRYLGENGLKRWILKQIEKFTCRLSTNIECVSKSNLDLGVDESVFKRNKATVVLSGSSGGVDLSKFDFSKRGFWREEKRTELGIKPDDFVYGFVGRITRDKGVNELLSSFARINDGSKLILVGDFETNNSLDISLVADSKKNPNIFFCNHSLSVEKYYAAFDVLLLPSYREGFGNVVIEAAACGTPSIVSNIPGPKDTIVESITGIFCEPKNVKSLLDSMEMIKKLDLKSMGEAAYKHVASLFATDVLNSAILERKIQLIKEVSNDR